MKGCFSFKFCIKALFLLKNSHLVLSYSSLRDIQFIKDDNVLLRSKIHR